MDKRIANNIVLGGFVLIAFGVFILLVFNMGGGQGLFSSQVSLFCRFPQVKGLHFGSEVSLSGLRIGTIKSITIANDDSKDLIIEMTILSKVMERLRKDSTVQVVTQGVLGDKYLELTIGSPNSEPLKSGDFINGLEVPDLFSKGNGLVDDLKNEFGKGSDLDSLISNLNRLALNLNQIAVDAQRGKGLLYEFSKGQSGEKLNRTLEHLDSILKKVDNGDGTLGALVNDPTVYEDVKTVLGGAKRSSILQYFMRQFRDNPSDKQPKK